MEYKNEPYYRKLYEETSEHLKKEKKHGVFGLLLKEVVRTGKCIKCAACESSCPELGWNESDGEPVLIGKCNSCGTCYYQCPVVHRDILRSEVKPFNYYSVKSELDTSLIGNIQNGGAVSTILYYLLTEEEFDGAVVVVKDPENPWYPKAVFITDPNDIFRASGTVYTHAQVIPPLVEAVTARKARKIAFVGTPCNIDSVVSMMRKDGFLSRVEGLEIVKISLFCMEAFDPYLLYSHLKSEGVVLKKAEKMEISGGRFMVFAEGKKIFSRNVKKLEEFVETSCKFCTDFTGTNADISVGNVGTPDNFNTVITRSRRGDDIIKKMAEKGYITAERLSREGLQELGKMIEYKRNKEIPAKFVRPKIQKDRFILHKPQEWSRKDFGFRPELRPEYYVRKEYELKTIAEGGKESTSNFGEKPDVYIARIPSTDDENEIISYNYTTAYDLTYNLLKDYKKMNGGKVLVKPNNTGFVGIFKTDVLKDILEKNGISDNADLQPIATQPSILKGIVDALLDLGVKRIDIGENMLWSGGTPRAFYETGYAEIFSADRYRKKVYFVDFYENDPPADSLCRLYLPPTDYAKVDYYTRCFPPKALFEEKYDLIYIASIVKTHNCSYYSLSVKNFSVTWNPRKKTDNIPPRWHIHGLPVNIFLKKNVKKALGEDFVRKYKYVVREVFKYPYSDENYKERIVKRKKRKVIISNGLTSSGLMDTVKSWNYYAFDVDPHHWTGINIGVLNLGVGYLITRYTRIFAAVLKKLYANGTRVAALCSAIVGQERDGPLIYGSRKYAGFAAASFDHVALEKVVLDMMFGEGNGGFREFIVNYQRNLMKKYGIKDNLLIKDAEELWTLKMLKNMIGGELDNTRMNLYLLDYDPDGNLPDGPNSLCGLRKGAPFEFSTAFYVSPRSWLHALHTDDGLAAHAFVVDKKSIEIPLIPGVVR